MTLDEIRNLPPAEAIEVLDNYIAEAPSDEEAYTLRGLKHWALGHHSKAINDYLKAISINPEGKAKHALASANEILNFYNKDIYNP